MTRQLTRGFVIMAQGEKYVTCAKALERNLKQVMPNENVTIITTDMLPLGDLAPESDWKLINDYQVYAASPYDLTIKLEADMYVPASIEYWWEILKDRDVVVSTTIRNFKQEVSKIRAYRKFIDDNNLPDCYNGITYFRKSEFAEEFFNTVKLVFNNWDRIRATYKCNIDELATTDWVYAICCHVLGVEKTTMPTFDGMSFVHMKQYINNLPTEAWTNTLVYEILPNTFRINTYPQLYPVHYYVKSFAEKILEAQDEH